MSKSKARVLLGVTIVLVIVLFCVRLTGEVVHALLGVAFTGIMIYHVVKRGKKLSFVPKRYQVVDYVLLITLGVICVSGVLLHPLKDIMLIKILHKLASVVFCIATIGHVVQHKKKGKKKNVS